jgi:hypothetical protein
LPAPAPAALHRPADNKERVDATQTMLTDALLLYLHLSAMLGLVVFLTAKPA